MHPYMLRACIHASVQALCTSSTHASMHAPLYKHASAIVPCIHHCMIRACILPCPMQASYYVHACIPHVTCICTRSMKAPLHAPSMFHYNMSVSVHAQCMLSLHSPCIQLCLLHTCICLFDAKCMHAFMHALLMQLCMTYACI